ncbi:MAG: DNA translocase FtsK [bacterium]
MNRKQRIKISRKEEILGILLMTLGILVLVSLLTYNSHEQPGNITIGKIDNQLGVAGVYISYFLIQYIIGYPSFVFPVIIFLWGWNLFRGNRFSITFRWTAYLLIFAIYTSIILAIPEVTSKGASNLGYALSGLIGGLIAQTLFTYLGIAGSIVVLLFLIMITVIGATNFSFAGTFAALGEALSSTIGHSKNKFEKWRDKRKIKTEYKTQTHKEEITWREIVKPQRNMGEKPSEKSQIHPPGKQLEKEIVDDVTNDSFNKNSYGKSISAQAYVFPSLELLTLPKTPEDEISKDELITNAQVLEKRLLEFGVQGKVVEISPGPVITRYEVEPASGVKVSRITALADDLALAMRAKSIRIVAPIPGKGAVGIEIPNRKHSLVFLRDIIESAPFQNSDSPLTIALGKTISGEPYVTKLDQMPHLLIAGATGSGKSVCLNTIIASILFKAHPTQVQLVMIDPKRLELSIYKYLRHHHLTYREDLNEEVITSATNAISVLKSLEAIMENRYKSLARAGVRNIVDFNRKLKSGQLRNLNDKEPIEPLEYLVLIIDELADLMLIAAKEVEEPIARLTQMSRAVGIHLILATQRPSVDVITGVIKANFPARIAFQVASKTDSRTILDANGAEKLLGMGDMLFIAPGSAEPVRIHGTYISSDEIEAIISHIRKQPRFPKHTLPIAIEESVEYIEERGIGGKRDELFNEALKLVVRHQQGSISLLQRRLKVGYARAARLIDELEAAGVVGAFDGSKAREVLIDEQQLEEMGL